MRFAGIDFRQLSIFSFAALVLLAVPSSLRAQQAPQVLPYTVSTFAGPHAAYTVGAACGSRVALDTLGDGCYATDVSVGADPHDLRVDAKGNVYYIDNASLGYIHKINATTKIESMFLGSTTQSKACAAATDTYGDNCVSTDGAANNNPLILTTTSKVKTMRGMSIAPNGDILIGGYNDYYVHKISASTGIYSVVAGTGTSTTGATTGPALTTGIGSSRGAAADSNGTVYIADTAQSVIQQVANGQITLVTAPNTSVTKSATSGVLASTALVASPEDVAVDPNGNLYISDAGNNVVRAVYMGKGSLIGVSNPQTGYIYSIAGGGSGTYAIGSSTIAAAVPATSISLAIRHIAFDNRGNLYIADTTDGYIWFVDATTGYIRLMLGNYGGTIGGAATGCAASSGNTIGDGCPGVQAMLYGTSATSIGVSPDNQGNLYISDPQGGPVASSRIRKQLSGLNFPVTASGVTVTQSIDIHFGAGDSAAATGAYTFVGTTSFAAGTATCTTNADTTVDCILPVTYTATKPGYDTGTLTIKSTLGGASAYLVSGTGTVASVVVDPGQVTALTATATSSPASVLVGGGGITYIADTANNRILAVNGSTTTVFAGTGTAGYSGDSGLATSAALNGPTAMAIGTGGSLLIADTGNNVIRRVSRATGIITTYAGGASSVCSTATNTRGDACLATSALFSKPAGLAVDRYGVAYISDTGNNVIRQVDLNGYVSTFAGGGTPCATSAGAVDVQGDGCPATQTTFSSPAAIAYDQTGNYLVVADTGNSLVRKINLGNVVTASSANVGLAVANPVVLVAGNGQAGSTVDSSSLATNSQLNTPKGVTVDAASNIYIADTGNHAVRLVTPAGLISTVGGILGASGATALPAASTDLLMNSPAGIAVSSTGQLVIADTANSRVLADARSSTSYNFGRVQPASTSTTQNFVELNVGTLANTLPSTLTSTGDTSSFSLISSSTGGCSGATLSIGGSCSLIGSFLPATTGTFSASYTYTESGSTAIATPTITLTGTGAILTTTSAVVAQSAPTTGNAQYGGSLTLTVTVAASTCNTAAPSCVPTGTARIIVDGVAGTPTTLTSAGTASGTFSGLAVGAHTVSCSYSGDGFYAAASCPSVTITVAPASTTSLLTISANNMPQFSSIVLTATVTSNTSGIPTGTVSFSATSTSGGAATSIGSSSLNASGVATFTMQQVLDSTGAQTSNSTLVPGTYNLSCTYNGSSNFATSSCTNVSFTVVADPASLTLVTKGCSTAATAATVTSAPNQGATCPSALFISGIPAVATAQGSTTDAAIFITPSNTLSGKLTFACSGLPTFATCTFATAQGSSYTLTAGTAYVPPIPLDVTLWTDVKDSASNTQPMLPGNRSSHTDLAMLLGWPLGLLGFAGLAASRRKLRKNAFLAAIPLAMLLLGGSMLAGGCAGPGNYTPNLTPAGQYPVTITITGPNGLTATTQVYFVVTSPGITGAQ
ncbi:MAG: Ig-like domain repeat protein [Acidobacteriaceae bacterium]|nr:Ig-like domain repeat protein [Acidobacteriaceae bacterium]